MGSETSVTGNTTSASTLGAGMNGISSATATSGAPDTSGSTTGPASTTASATTQSPTGGGGASSVTNTQGASSGGASSNSSNTTTANSTTSGGVVTGSTPWLHVDGNKIKNPAGQDVVLRGVSMIDIGSVEQWDGGVLQMVDRLTNEDDSQGSSPGWYPRVLRLPVYPHDSEDHNSPFTYQPGSTSFYDELLRPLIDYIGERGMYAIIDWHYIDDTNLHQQTTNQFWQDIAPRFANDSHVIFELYNEPINTQDGWSQVRGDMQTWYNTVRAAAPNNLVLVGTPNWCQIVSPAADNPIDGENVVYVAHMYPMHWEQQSLRDQITDAAATVPVFVSEWGYEEGSDDVVNGNQLSYGAPFKQFIDQQALSWTAWVAHNAWFPSMFDDNWNLLVGEGYMGGFAKDWLYERRNDGLAAP